MILFFSQTPVFFCNRQTEDGDIMRHMFGKVKQLLLQKINMLKVTRFSAWCWFLGKFVAVESYIFQWMPYIPRVGSRRPLLVLHLYQWIISHENHQTDFAKLYHFQPLEFLRVTLSLKISLFKVTLMMVQVSNRTCTELRLN